MNFIFDAIKNVWSAPIPLHMGKVFILITFPVMFGVFCLLVWAFFNNTCHV